MAHLDKSVCALWSLVLLADVLFLWPHRVRRNDSVNSMSCSNLAVIFGPTLLRPPPGDNQGSALQDMSAQCKAVETILEHYRESACYSSQLRREARR